MQVRVLTPGDLQAYRALHRYALEEAPYAFVESVANDTARPDSEVAAMLERGEGWGLFDGERLVGKLIIDRLPYDCLNHTRWMHAIYVHPDARGAGAAARLLQAAIDEAAAASATRIMLWVSDRNEPARRLYERLGFREVGRIPGGIRISGALADDVLMCLSLVP
jgi:RimJ/RimL family protein N-acetyltransferase